MTAAVPSAVPMTIIAIELLPSLSSEVAPLGLPPSASGCRVGDPVGLVVIVMLGESDGELVGLAVGPEVVGEKDGETVGAEVVGEAVGPPEGSDVGAMVGERVGLAVGSGVAGEVVGGVVGAGVGLAEGEQLAPSATSASQELRESPLSGQNKAMGNGPENLLS